MPSHQRSPAKGFTLLELLVVMGLMIVLMLLGLPALYNFIQRSKLEGVAHETALMVQAARYNAIKLSKTQSIVALDLATRQVVSCQDNDLNGKCDGTDVVLGRYTLPADISFAGPPGDVLPTTGLSPDPGGGSANIAILKADGSIQDAGGIRFADRKQNYLELLVSPQGTARVEVLKWDGTSFRSQGYNGKAWTWNT